jgi:hypothetical protein
VTDCAACHVSLVAPLVRIRDVPCSALYPETDYVDRGLLGPNVMVDWVALGSVFGTSCVQLLALKLATYTAAYSGLHIARHIP